jgi:predicted porin
MQKKLIALAITTAFSAPAFAETTVFGVADIAVTNISSTGNKSDLNLTSGGLSASRVGVETTEELSNGMKVIGVLEATVESGDSSAPFSASARQKMLALAGGFGTVAAGYLQTAGLDFSEKFNPTADSAVDSGHAVNPTNFITTESRLPKALAYISPDMNGLTIAVNRTLDANVTGAVANGATSGNKTTANALSAMYEAGPLAVGGVYVGTANDDTGYQKITEMGLGASYDFGAAKVFGAYKTTKTDATGVAGNSDKAIELHVVAPVTAKGAVVGSYAKSTISTDTSGNSDQNSFTLAYLDTLSKTVTAYGAVQKLSGKDTGGASTDTTVLAIGLRKKF